MHPQSNEERTAMAKGEMGFDASKRKVRRFDNSPPPAGEYDFKFRSSKATISVADGVGKLPFINGCQLELMDSASTEGGKNRIIYHSFFLGTTPPPGGETAAVDGGDGIVAFSKAIGVNLKLGPGAVIKKAAKNKKGVDYTALILDPKKVVAWLKEQDGSKGTVRTKTRPDRNDPEVKYGAVNYFIEAEEGSEEEEDEELEEESEETDEEDEEGEEDSEDEGDEDEDEDEEESDEEDDEDEDEEEPATKPKKGAKKKGKK